jgi:hypothetical protein
MLGFLLEHCTWCGQLCVSIRGMTSLGVGGGICQDPPAPRLGRACTGAFFFLHIFSRFFIHILYYNIHPGCHPGLGPTSLSGNSCSWAARGRGDWVRIEPRTGINNHRVRIEPGTGHQQSSVLTTELRCTPKSYAAAGARVLFGLLYMGLTWRGLIPKFIAISKLNFKHTYLKFFLRTTSSDLCLRTQLAMSISP